MTTKCEGCEKHLKTDKDVILEKNAVICKECGHTVIVLPVKENYTISLGELIDRLAITNIKMWHLDERISKLNKSGKKEDKIEAGELAGLTRDSNRERADLREELNLRLEGRSRGSNKIEYTKLGR